uniref:Uncharacterized protein n=1 Tax=Arundo donax TaxID=35708 RepID=A0A0A9AW44_ARUDO
MMLTKKCYFVEVCSSLKCKCNSNLGCVLKTGILGNIKL